MNTRVVSIIEGSLEVKLPTIWADEKAEVRRARREQSQRGEKIRRKKMQVCEKVGKSRNTVFFRCSCGSGGSKSRLAKAAGAETSGEMRNEKFHAVVARSRFRSEKVQNTWVSGHFWKLRCRKSARRCGAKHISDLKCTKHTILGPLLEVAMSKKCTPLWREAQFEVNMYKALHVHATFGGSDVVLRGRRKGLCTLSKVGKTWGFCSISRDDGRRGAFEEDLQRCISRGRCSTKDMFIRDVRRSGRSFPERGCILEYQIFRFAEMILRDMCSTSYDLASIFRGTRSTLHRWSGKIAKCIGTRLPSLHSTFHFWRKSRRIVLFLTLLRSNFEEVSQNCCRFGRC